MTTERKIEANRKNSKFSTGPQTTHGRARASRNALRHGLAISIASDPELSAEAECLAHVILGDDISPSRLDYARIAAQAEIDMRRIRRVRTRLMACRWTGRGIRTNPGAKPYLRSCRNLSILIATSEERGRAENMPFAASIRSNTFPPERKIDPERAMSHTRF
jgi:hypothetical protein